MREERVGVCKYCNYEFIYVTGFVRRPRVVCDDCRSERRGRRSADPVAAKPKVDIVGRYYSERQLRDIALNAVADKKPGAWLQGFSVRVSAVAVEIVAVGLWFPVKGRMAEQFREVVKL